MRKSFKQQKEESQIQWKNMSNDVKFNPVKKWYGVIKVGDKSFITEYESKFRSEVLAIFNEEARLVGGQLEVMRVYK